MKTTLSRKHVDSRRRDDFVWEVLANAVMTRQVILFVGTSFANEFLAT